jgi:hypothetical protein
MSFDKVAQRLMFVESCRNEAVIQSHSEKALAGKTAGVASTGSLKKGLPETSCQEQRGSWWSRAQKGGSTHNGTSSKTAEGGKAMVRHRRTGDDLDVRRNDQSRGGASKTNFDYDLSKLKRPSLV